MPGDRPKGKTRATRAAPRKRKTAAPAAASAGGSGLSREEYRALVENINDLLFSVDAEGRITYLSPVVASMSGYEPHEALGRNFAEFVCAADLPEVIESFHSTMAGVGKPLEFRLLQKSGDVRWVRSSSRPIVEDGRPAGVRGVITDLTERKGAESALRESEQRLREFVDNASDVIYTHDLNGRLHSINAAGERLTGYRREEVLGREVFHLVAPEDRQRVEEMIRRKLVGESVGPYELTVLTKDGRRLAVEVNSRPIVRDGRAVGMEGIARDLTERRKNEALAAERRSLTEEREIASALARVGREIISSRYEPALLERLCRLTTEVLRCDCAHTLVWDREEDVFTVGAGWGDKPEQAEAARVLKIPARMFSEVLKRFEGEDVVPAGAGAAEEALSQAFLRSIGLSAALMSPLRREESVIGILSASFRGKAKCFAPTAGHIVRGVAHLGSLALGNAQLVAELESANRMKSDFVSTMSHELRTPLNVIIGYTHLLLDDEFGPLNEDQRETSRRIDKNARELLDLVDATLAVGRIETGRLTVTMRETSVEDLLREIDVETRDRRQKPDVAFIWDVAPQLPSLYTDPLKLKVVIKNLIGNALKFTPAGSITVRVSRLDGGVEFAVIDTGIGIAPDAQALIFERFRQAHDSSSESYGGVGLGLFIVHRLLDVLGGRVAVESEVGRGSTFRVWVPVGWEHRAVE